MSQSPWIAHLGESSENQKLRAALADVGVASVPTIAKNETTSKVHLKDAQLIFSAAELFPQLAEGGDGTSVLTGVLLPVNRKWGVYDGALPFELQRNDSREKLRSRFGAPVQSNDSFHWDEWRVEGRVLRVEFSAAHDQVELVSIKLPRK